MREKNLNTPWIASCYIEGIFIKTLYFSAIPCKILEYKDIYGRNSVELNASKVYSGKLLFLRFNLTPISRKPAVECGS